MTIAVIDYKMGNLGSIMNMFLRLGIEAVLTDDLAEIERADKLILPGVGAFDRGMENLHKLGIIPLLNEKVVVKKTPILGLCLGMQLFAKGSEEGKLPGLGWVDGDCIKFHFDHLESVPVNTQIYNRLKVPHMGWNNLKPCKAHYIFEGLEPEARYYFVHSYYVQCNDPQDELAKSLYGMEFTSALQHESIIGLQFHPEKSLRWGMQVLKRFAEHD
jgi:glutamine amidotransferase